jgi:predicted nucleic acid-binding protein
MVLVDTVIWSAALRQSGSSHPSARNALATLIRIQGVAIIGPIRQEILSGISDKKQFSKLREELSHFPDHELAQADFEEAARCFNLCRAKGIQGSNTDFLICAVSLRHKFPILTTDRDFESFATVLGIILFEM